MTDNDKKPMSVHSSAASVEQHLKELEKTDYETLYYSQEQSFSADELARVVNKQRLNELLAQSDEFLSSLDGDLRDFDEGSSH